MISALLAWLVLSTYLAPPEPTTAVTKKEERPAIKTEPSESEPNEPDLTEGLSDTSRIFPTLGRLKPLQFTVRGGGGGDRGREEEDPIKKEEEEDVLQTTSVQPLGAEADDEDDDFGVASGFKDSGIGTSLDEAQRAQAQQRRRKPLFGNRE